MKKLLALFFFIIIVLKIEANNFKLIDELDGKWGFINNSIIVFKSINNKIHYLTFNNDNNHQLVSQFYESRNISSN